VNAIDIATGARVDLRLERTYRAIDRTLHVLAMANGTSRNLRGRAVPRRAPGAEVIGAKSDFVSGSGGISE
jgi:hypothetical protein